jgi:Spy/CpxP family protein refolding chaperone
MAPVRRGLDARVAIVSVDEPARAKKYTQGGRIMNTRLIKAAVGIALMATVLTATACHRHQSPSERAEWMTGKITKHLDLDDQQKAKLAAVKEEVLAARAEGQKEHRALVEDVIAQVQSDRLDQTKVAQLIEQYQGLQRRLMVRVLPKVADWHATLRPEQKAEAVEHLRRWMEHHEGAK